MPIDVEGITAKVEADEAAGRFKETDTVDLKDSGVETVEDLDASPETPPDDQLGAQPPAAPEPPKWNPLNIGGKAWLPDQFTKDPASWDQFGGVLKNWEADYTRKRQAEAAESKRIEQEYRQTYAEFQKQKEELDRYGDPTYGPALLIQTLQERYGIAVPEALQRQILLDPVRQLQMRMDQQTQALEQKFQSKFEEQEQAKRLATVDQTWNVARTSLGIPEQAHERLFDAWASYQIGDQPMSPEEATDQVNLLIGDILDPKGWAKLPDKYRKPIETEIVRAYNAKKAQQANTTPLTSTGAPPATSIGRQQGARKMPSQMGGMDKYTDMLVKRANGQD